MAPDDDTVDDALVGRRAVDWLFGRPNGGHFFDGAYIGVHEAFGDHALVAALAPLGRTAEATDFFFVVEGRVDRDRDWEKLVRAQLLLGRQTDQLRPAAVRRRARDPFERFHLVLDPELLDPVPLIETSAAWLGRS